MAEEAINLLRRKMIEDMIIGNFDRRTRRRRQNGCTHHQTARYGAR